MSNKKEVDTTYNKQEMKKELKEKIDDLRIFCATNGIPFFVTCAIKNDKKKTEYLNELIDPALFGIHLNEDYIHEHLKVSKGFRAATNGEPLELEFETSIEN